MEKVIAVFIQARTGSKRFPKKILMSIENKPMIWHVINRVKKSQIKKIVLLTTNLEEDQKLKKICEEMNVGFFAGDESNVLNRFYRCAKQMNVDIIIRITGDCPLVDPLLINKMINVFLCNNYDYVSNIIEPTFPDGLDIEIFSRNSLEITNREAKLNSEKEHVTPYIIKNPKKFKLYNYKNKRDLSNLRWTVDKELDLKFVKKIYNKMKPSLDFSTSKILEILEKFPEIKEINSKINRNEGYQNSLKND